MMQGYQAQERDWDGTLATKIKCKVYITKTSSITLNERGCIWDIKSRMEHQQQN